MIFLLKIKKVWAAFIPYWANLKGRSFDLKFLEMHSADKERIGEIFASISPSPTHPLLDTKSADIIYSALQQNPPEQHIRRCIAEDRIRPFNGERFVRYPDVIRIISLVRHAGHDGGLVIIINGAHHSLQKGLKDSTRLWRTYRYLQLRCHLRRKAHPYGTSFRLRQKKK